MDIKSKKVVIVHDWLIGGGAERVVAELHQMFPDAPIYTSYASDEWRRRLDGKVITGFLQRGPFPKLRKFVPYLRAWWFSSLDLSAFDLVISSSGAEAKGVKVTGNAVHINYCHAPTHYYWNRYNEYMANPGFGAFNSVARFGLKLLVGPMRKWDYKAAQRPKFILANSTYTQDEINKYYNRASTVIHPPVDIKRFESTATDTPRSGFVITGRQTAYKRVDLAVAACSEINVPLTVIGDGPEHDKLVAMAGPTVKFLANLSDPEVAAQVRAAKAFIFPGIDDFGISAVEAIAAGTPLVAYKAGGAMDYVIAGETGLFFEQQTPESLALVLASFDSSKFNPENLENMARQFSQEVFQYNILEFIKNNVL